VGSIITVLIALWLAAMIPAVIAPLLLSRSRVESAKDAVWPTSLNVSRRSVSHVEARCHRDRIAA